MQVFNWNFCHWTVLQSKSYHCKCIKKFSWSDCIGSLLLKKEVNCWEMVAACINMQTNGCSHSLSGAWGRAETSPEIFHQFVAFTKLFSPLEIFSCFPLNYIFSHWNSMYFLKLMFEYKIFSIEEMFPFNLFLSLQLENWSLFFYFGCVFFLDALFFLKALGFFESFSISLACLRI